VLQQVTAHGASDPQECRRMGRGDRRVVRWRNERRRKKKEREKRKRQAAQPARKR